MRPLIRHRRPLVIAVILALLATCGFVPASVPRAEAQFAVFDASNFGQNTLTAVRTARAILQRIEMIRHQIRQIEIALRNLQDLDEPTFRSILSHLLRLERTMERETEGLVYTLRHLDHLYRQTYPHGEEAVAEDLTDAQRQRVETSLETARAALLATQLQGEDLEASQRTLARMRQEALDTEGHLQALQALGLLEAHTAQEVGKLHQQALIQTNLLAVVLAHEISSRSAAAETLRESVEAARRAPRAYAATQPLPVIPPGLPRR